MLKEKMHVFEPAAGAVARIAEHARRPRNADDVPDAEIRMVQPTLEFLSPTFAEFRLFIATLMFCSSRAGGKSRRAMIMNFGDRTARLRTLRMLNEIEEHLGNYLLMVAMIKFAVGVITPA